MSALVPTFVVACTSVDKTPSNVRATSLDFEGSWVGLEFPCASGRLDLVLTLKRVKSDLSARVGRASECAPFDALVWQGTLPFENIDRDDLPLTFRCDVRLPSPRTGSVTLLSADRMVLLIGDASITLQRGTLRTRIEPDEAGTRAHAGAGGGETTSRMPDSGSPAAGTGGVSGSMAGPPGGADGSSNAGAGAAAGGSSGSSGTGTPNSMNAGGGGSSGDPGSARDAGQGDASTGRGPDASATDGGGQGTAAGSGGAGGAGSGGDDPPPTAGSGAAYPVGPPDISGRRWDCINLLGFCDCIAYPESEGGGRSCSQKLPCCYTDLDNDKPQCICEAAQPGGGCYVFGTDARRPSVDWCPGQSD